MNKTYRLIWCKARGAIQVVSELAVASSGGKTATTNLSSGSLPSPCHTFKKTLLATLIMLLPPFAEAVTYITSSQLNLSNQNYSDDIQADSSSTVSLDASEVVGNVTLADSTLTATHHSKIDGNLIANHSNVTLGSGTIIGGRTTISNNSDVTLDGSFLTFDVSSTDSQLTLKNNTGINHALTVTGGSLSMDNSYVIDSLLLGNTSAVLSNSKLFTGLHAGNSTIQLSNGSTIDGGADLNSSELTLDAGTRLSGGATVSSGSHLIADGATLSGDIQTDWNSTVSLNAVNSTGAVTLDNGSQLLASNQTTVSGNIAANHGSTVSLDESEVAGNVTLADSTLTTTHQSKIDGNLIANHSNMTLGSGTIIGGRTTISNNSDVTLDGSFLTFDVSSTDSQLTLKNNTGINHALTVTGGSLSMDNSYVIDSLLLGNTSAVLSNSKLFTGLHAGNSTIQLSNGSTIDGGADLNSSELTLDAGTRLSGGASVDDGSHLIADGATLSGDVVVSRNSLATLGNLTASGNIQADSSSTVSLDESEVAGNVTLADSTLTTTHQSKIDGNLIANHSNVTLGSGTIIGGRTTISNNSDVTLNSGVMTFDVNSTDSRLTLQNYAVANHSLTVSGGSLAMDHSYVVDNLMLVNTSAALSHSGLFSSLDANNSTVWLSNGSYIDRGTYLYSSALTLDADTRLSGGATVRDGSHLIADGAVLSGDVIVSRNSWATLSNLNASGNIQADWNSTVSLNAVNSSGAVTLDNSSQLLASSQTVLSGNIEANGRSSLSLNNSEAHGDITLQDSSLVAENGAMINGGVTAASSEINLEHSAIDGALGLINSQANLTLTSSVSGLVSLDQTSSLKVSNGRLDGGVVNHGRLTLGTSTSANTPLSTFGNLTVSGNYNQSATGVLGINLYDTSLYSRLNVSGDVNLDGILAINVINGSPIASRDQIASVIHASGTLSGTFSQITDNSALFNFKATYGNQDVNLQVVTASSTGISDAVSPQINPSLTSSANVLDHIISQDTTGQIAAAFTPLVTNQEISNAVLQTLPMSMLGGMPAIQTSFSGISDTVANHLNSFGPTGQSSGDTLTADERLWVKPFASWTKQRDQDGVNGFTSNTGGFVFGLDGQMNEKTRLGAAFAYADVDLNSHGSSSQTAKINVYQLMGYGTHLFDNQTKLNFQADIGLNQTEGNRHISFAGVVAKAKYNSTSAHLGASLARSFQLSNDVLFTPSIGADYTWVRDRAYSETGAGAFNLNVANQSTKQFLIGAKGKLAYQLTPSTQFSMDAGLSYDLKSKQAMITSAYASSPDATFVTYGPKPSRWLASMGLGLTHKTDGGIEITGRYDGTFRKGYQNHSASVTFRWQY